MDPNQPKQPTPKELEKMRKDRADDMAKKYSFVFTKQEVIVMFNILVSQQYRIGDASIVIPIVKKLEGIAAVETNISPSQQMRQAPPPEAGKVILEEAK